MTRVFKRPRARRDLIDQYSYLAEHGSVDIADRFLARAEETFCDLVRLSKAFGGSAELWLRLQANYDLAQVREDQIDVKRYRRAS